MAIIARNKKGTEIEILEAGAYPARIYQLIHIGTVVGYQGMLQNKVRIGFELPTEMKVFDEKKGEQPRVISQEYTLSFSEKSNLRKLILSCDPKALDTSEDGFVDDFDVEALLGKELLITIAHKQKKDGSGSYAYIESVTRLPKGMTCAEQINPTQLLAFDKWSDEIFNKLPDFLKDAIKSSEEYKVMNGEIPTDGVPFD
jgi:hypothetical protein